jgi:hypothetical protein
MDRATWSGCTALVLWALLASLASTGNGCQPAIVAFEIEGARIAAIWASIRRIYRILNFVWQILDLSCRPNDTTIPNALLLAKSALEGSGQKGEFP